MTSPRRLAPRSVPTALQPATVRVPGKRSGSTAPCSRGTFQPHAVLEPTIERARARLRLRGCVHVRCARRCPERPDPPRPALVHADRPRADRHLDRERGRHALPDPRADRVGGPPRHRQPPRRHPDEQRLPLALRPARGRAARCGRTAASPPAPIAFPRVIFKNRASEGNASAAGSVGEPRYTRDDYFCLSVHAVSSSRDALDAMTCPSRLQ